VAAADAAEARATVRFETPPGKQLQIDFGEKDVLIAGESTRVHLFVATLGYSRRNFAMAFPHERQAAWLGGIEAAFAHFGGLPEQLLIDNARALVEHHDAATREVRFNERFHAFCRYWGVRPTACAPYRARTKGKDENGVGYVKRNAMAGRDFASWEALAAICSSGCARSPTSACTAAPASAAGALSRQRSRRAAAPGRQAAVPATARADPAGTQ
jgi:transposase